MTDHSEITGSSFFLDVGAGITLLLALFYTPGWSFAYHYFDKFHLGLIGLDISKEYLFMYSFQALRNHLFLSFCALLSSTLLYLLMKLCFEESKKAMRKRSSEQGIYKKRKYEIFMIFGIFLKVVMIFLLFCQCYHIGTLRASALFEEQVLNDFEAYPRVKVWMKRDIPDELKEKAVDWEKGCYKLLLRSKDFLYLFKPGTGNPTDIIPQSNVQAVRVLPLYNKCNE